MLTLRFLSKLNRISRRIVVRTLSVKIEANEEQLEKETHFGFSSVKESEKAQKVHEVFEDVATSYDKMNDAMSLGIHRIWKDIFVAKLGDTDRTHLLDVAGGTGDISFRYLRRGGNERRATICDINSHMLEVGKKRAQNEGISMERLEWREGDAEKLPFPDNSFDAYTIAFGIRNVTHIDQALSEAYRVLVPGGRFLCLEFSHVSPAPVKWMYDQYSLHMIPVIGQLVAGQWKAYQYLVESIRRFPNQQEFSDMIGDAGFRCVTWEDLTMGVVAIHSGFKL